MTPKYIVRGPSFVMRVAMRACGVHTVTTSGGALQGLEISKRRGKGSAAKIIRAALNAPPQLRGRVCANEMRRGKTKHTHKIKIEGRLCSDPARRRAYLSERVVANSLFVLMSFLFEPYRQWHCLASFLYISYTYLQSPLLPFLPALPPFLPS